MLLLDDDDELPATPDRAERLLADALGPSGVRDIDEALLHQTTPRWSKVARVVADALDQGSRDLCDDARVSLYARRIIALVESGALQAQGDLRKPRWSEVRTVAPL
jgi:hypothetical protein